MKPTSRRMAVKAGVLSGLGLLLLAAYSVYPWLCRRSAAQAETTAGLAGDDIVPHSIRGYTLATSIAAPPSAVWPWLVQIGQGRGGFYTHEWVEDLMGAEIRNTNQIVPELQRLAPGDTIRLTPDPYLGRPGQYLVAARIDPPTALVFRQVLPNGTTGSWAYVLRPRADGSTRLLFRRRGTRASVFDRIMTPGYYFMDVGMLAGVKARAEGSHTE